MNALKPNRYNQICFLHSFQMFVEFLTVIILKLDITRSMWFIRLNSTMPRECPLVGCFQIENLIRWTSCLRISLILAVRSFANMCKSVNSQLFSYYQARLYSLTVSYFDHDFKSKYMNVLRWKCIYRERPQINKITKLQQSTCLYETFCLSEQS